MNNIRHGKVVNVNKTHVIISFDNKERGLLHLSEISDYYINDINKIFKIGNYYDFLELSKDDQNRSQLSWKRINPRFLKHPFKYAIKATPSNFKNLKKKVEKELND